MKNQSVSDFVAATMDAVLNSPEHKSLFGQPYKQAKSDKMCAKCGSDHSDKDSCMADDNAAKKKKKEESSDSSSASDQNDARKKKEESSDSSSASDQNDAKKKKSEESSDSSSADDNDVDSTTANPYPSKQYDAASADDQDAKKKKKSEESSDSSSADDNADDDIKKMLESYQRTGTPSVQQTPVQPHAPGRVESGEPGIKTRVVAFDVAIDSLLTASAALDSVGLGRGSALTLKIASLVVEAKKKDKKSKKSDKKSSEKKKSSK